MDRGSNCDQLLAASVSERRLRRIEQPFQMAKGLRDLTFAGSSIPEDLDAYDTGTPRYRQLLAWDSQEREIVSMYRYLHGASIAPERYTEQLASGHLFEFSYITVNPTGYHRMPASPGSWSVRDGLNPRTAGCITTRITCALAGAKRREGVW